MNSYEKRLDEANDRLLKAYSLSLDVKYSGLLHKCEPTLRELILTLHDHLLGIPDFKSNN